MQRLLVLTLLVAATSAHRTFVDTIPNGDKVPSPCPAGGIWIGTGHLSMAGGGGRDQFGVDFGGLGNRWTLGICRLDSDGDGLTNGQELGDPNCEWTPGFTPSRTTNITHPSVCEPITSPNCMSQRVPPQKHGRNYTDQSDWLNDACASHPTAAPADVTTPGGTGVASLTTLPCQLLQLTCTFMAIVGTQILPRLI